MLWYYLKCKKKQKVSVQQFQELAMEGQSFYQMWSM